MCFEAILSRFVTALLAELSAELHSAAEDSVPSACIPVPTIHIILFKYGSNNSSSELFTPSVLADGVCISYFLSLSMKNTSSQQTGCTLAAIRLLAWSSLSGAQRGIGVQWLCTATAPNLADRPLVFSLFSFHYLPPSFYGAFRSTYITAIGASTILRRDPASWAKARALLPGAFKGKGIVHALESHQAWLVYDAVATRLAFSPRLTRMLSMFPPL